MRQSEYHEIITKEMIMSVKLKDHELHYDGNPKTIIGFKAFASEAGLAVCAAIRRDGQKICAAFSGNGNILGRWDVTSEGVPYNIQNLGQLNL